MALATDANMQAAILYGKEDVRLESVPIPSIGPGELLVRVRTALTCGTDVKVFRRGYHAKMIRPPALFGHEMAGDVVEVGDGIGQISRRPTHRGGEFRSLRRLLFLPARSAEPLPGSAVQ